MEITSAVEDITLPRYALDWDKVKHPRGDGGKFTSSYGEEFQKHQDGASTSYTSHSDSAHGEAGHTTHLVQDPQSKKWQRGMSDDSCGKSFFSENPKWYDSPQEAAENTDTTMYRKMMKHRGDLHDDAGQCIYDDTDPDFKGQLDRAHQTGFSKEMHPFGNLNLNGGDEADRQRERSGVGQYYEPGDSGPPHGFYSPGYDGGDDPYARRDIKQLHEEQGGGGPHPRTDDSERERKHQRAKNWHKDEDPDTEPKNWYGNESDDEKYNRLLDSPKPTKEDVHRSLDGDSLIHPIKHHKWKKTDGPQRVNDLDDWSDMYSERHKASSYSAPVIPV